MRRLIASLSPRAEKTAIVALIVLFYVVAYVTEPGTFPEVLVSVFFFAVGYVPGHVLALLAPSPRRLSKTATRLIMASLAMAALAVFFVLPSFVGPHLGEVGRGLLVGSFAGTLLGRREP